MSDATESPLTYHDYICLLAFLRDTPGIRQRKPLGQDVCRDFTRACAEYREEVERQCRSVQQNNFRNGQFTYSGCQNETSQMHAALFRPAHYVSFGHSDSLALVLADSFDSMFSITNQPRSAIEQVFVGMCPDLHHLAADLPGNEHLASLHDLLGATGQPGDDPSRHLHGFQAELPLIVVTRFKLSALATLTEGVMLKRAVLRCIVRRLGEVLGDLRNYAQTVSDCAQSRKSSSAPPPLLDDGDVASLQCSVVDLQGAAELCTLMFCRNYTVALSVVVALRCLTLGDLWQEDPRLPDMLARRGDANVLQYIRKLDPDLASARGRPEESAAEHLAGNHVFTSTYSACGATYPSLQSPDPERCRGYVEVCSQFDVLAGHERHIESCLTDFFYRVSCEPRVDLGPFYRVHRFCIGRHDLILTTAQLIPGQTLKEWTYVALPCHEFLELARDMIARLCEEEDETGLSEPHVQDLNDVLTVPYPVIRDPITGADKIVRNVDAPRHASMTNVLALVHEALVGDGNDAAGGGAGLFSAKKRNEWLHELRVPAALRQTLNYLHTNFTTCLLDPLVFDAVLDLYDAFATLDEALRLAALDAKEAAKEPQPLQPHLRLSRAQIDHLTRLLNALQNALSHRIAANPPHLELRDMSVDFRGHLVALVAGADVPLKCGLGVLKRIARRTRQWEKLAGRNRVAAVARFTSHPQTTRDEIQLWSENTKSDMPRQWYSLSVVNINAAHIMHPAELVNYFHEAAHALESCLVGPTRACRWLSPKGVPRNGAPETVSLPGDQTARVTMRERLGEVFAGMMTSQFVFHGESDLYLRHFLMMYSNHPESIGVDSSDTRNRFAEILFRCFLVTDPVATGDADAAAKLWNAEAGHLPNAYEVAAAEERFLEMVRCYAPYVALFEQIWNHPIYAQMHRDFVRRHFRAVFPATYEFAKATWKWIRRQYAFDYPALADDQSMRRPADVSASIEDLLRRGQPIVGDDVLGMGSNGTRADDLLRVGFSIRAYLKLSFEHIDPSRGLHVPIEADAAGKNPADSAGQGGWNPLLLDPSKLNLLCVSPPLRRQRLRWEIALLQSMWDVSTHFRARRFVEIVQQSFSEEELAPAENEASH